MIASLAARLCFHKSLFAGRSRICFSTFISYLIAAFELSIQFESVFIFETVIGIQGLSLDSTHTEPCAHRLSFLGNTLSLSSLPQHFSTTKWQGRFRGLLLCAAIETQQAATAEVPTGRRVCKLLCKQGLLVVQWQCIHSPLCLMNYRLRQLVSNSQQHPSRVVTTSLCYRSDIPSLRTPMSRSRASKQLSDATLCSVVINGSTNWI